MLKVNKNLYEMYMILEIYRGTFNTAKSRFLHNNNTEKI